MVYMHVCLLSGKNKDSGTSDVTVAVSEALSGLPTVTHFAWDKSVTIRPQNSSQAQNPKTPTPKPQTPTAN